MTKRAGKRKNRQGVGPLKPAPGPQGPLKVENSLLTGQDNLPEAQSVAMTLQALNAGWMLTAGAKLKEAVITRLLNMAGEIIKKPIEQMSDAEFERLMAIFRSVSNVEQRQQRLEIAKAMAVLRTLYPPGSGSGGGKDLPPQVNVGIVNNVGSQQAQSVEARPIPAWQAVQQLLGVKEVQEVVKSLPPRPQMSDQLSPQAG